MDDNDIDAQCDGNVMSHLSPGVLRDKILGTLYPHYPDGITWDELLAKMPEANENEISREYKHLEELELTKPPTGAGEILLPIGLQKVGPVYGITARGRESVETKNSPRKTETAGKKRERQVRVQADLKRANEWYADGQQAAWRAGELKARGDHPGSVASSQKAIEFCAKALFPAAGFEAPKTHGVGAALGEIISKVAGDEIFLGPTRHTIVRLAWQSDVAAALQEIAEYGYLNVPAKDFVNERDAELWLGYANEAIGGLGPLLLWIDSGKIGFD